MWGVCARAVGGGGRGRWGCRGARRGVRWGVGGRRPEVRGSWCRRAPNPQRSARLARARTRQMCQVCGCACCRPPGAPVARGSPAREWPQNLTDKPKRGGGLPRRRGVGERMGQTPREQVATDCGRVWAWWVGGARWVGDVVPVAKRAKKIWRLGFGGLKRTEGARPSFEVGKSRLREQGGRMRARVVCGANTLPGRWGCGCCRVGTPRLPARNNSWGW